LGIQQEDLKARRKKTRWETGDENGGKQQREEATKAIKKDQELGKIESSPKNNPLGSSSPFLYHFLSPILCVSFEICLALHTRTPSARLISTMAREKRVTEMRS
jgi:hypothetical protein